MLRIESPELVDGWKIQVGAIIGNRYSRRVCNPPGKSEFATLRGRRSLSLPQRAWPTANMYFTQTYTPGENTSSTTIALGLLLSPVRVVTLAIHHHQHHVCVARVNAPHATWFSREKVAAIEIHTHTYSCIYTHTSMMHTMQPAFAAESR